MQITGESPLRRRLAELGIGASLALAYWCVVLLMFLVALIFILITMGPGIILVWVILCFVAWGVGMVLMLVAGGLVFVPRLQLAAIGFIAVSAFAIAMLALGLAAALVVAAYTG
jgi:hypothetical protein